MKNQKGLTWEEYRSKYIHNKSDTFVAGITDSKEKEIFNSNKCDVIYVVAMDDELDHLLNVYGIDTPDYKYLKGIGYIGFQHKVNENRNINIAILRAFGKGLVPAATYVTQAIIEFNPKIIIMTGVCATPKGKAEFGDIILFDSVYLHDEGKITSSGLQPDIKTIGITKKTEIVCDRLMGHSEIVTKISKKWPEGITRREPLSVKKGLAASGMAVIANKDSIIEKVSHNRSLIAIDMEAYAVAYCSTHVNEGCDWLVIKSVQDNGDEEKKDFYRHYACFTSAMYSLYFLNEYFSE